MPLSARFLFARHSKNMAGAISPCSAHDTAPNLMKEYLTSRCGLTPAMAAKVAESSPVARLSSTEKPDAVLSYLRALGLGDSDVTKLVTWRPQVLAADVERTLKPKIANLRALGFSSTDVTDIVVANFNILFHKTVVAKFEFLRALLPDKGKLFKALRKDVSLISCSLDKRLMPNAQLLREHGVPEHDVSRALHLTPWMLTQDTEFLGKAISRAEQYGFTPESGMYIHAIYLMIRVSEEALEQKFDLLSSFGLSKSDSHAMFCKKPYAFGLSLDSLRKRMNFLTKIAGIEAQTVGKHPVLTLFSVEKRLAPRLRVHRELEANGLLGPRDTVLSLFLYNEGRFLVKFIVPHLRQVPKLSDIYPVDTSKL